MGNLICPLVPLFPRAYLLPGPLCLGAHLPQRLFISKSISPGANLPRCLLCQCPFSPSPYLHSACSPFIPRTHLLWFPFLLVSTFLVTHFPGAHFPKCRFGPIQKRLFPCDPTESYMPTAPAPCCPVSPFGFITSYTIFSSTQFDLSPICRRAQSSIVSLSSIGHF